MEKKDDINPKEEQQASEGSSEDVILEEVQQEDPEQPFETNGGSEEDAHIQNDVSTNEKELEQKLEESQHRLLRLQADYENLRRRSKQDKEADAKYRSQRLAEELLPAMDNFERALNTTTVSEDADSLKQGMEMVYRQLKAALSQEGIEAIETVGQPFDPHYHQAVMQVELEDYDKNVVVEELQKGYKLKDRVIRPAMVKVNG